MNQLRLKQRNYTQRKSLQNQLSQNRKPNKKYFQQFTIQKIMSEIKIHKSLSQTNIVLFEHYFEDSENVYILLELCPNQTMNELIRRRKRLTELEVQCFLVQLLVAIKYMQKNKVIHRDLKLGNLFLSEKMEIKIGDFGLATKVDFEGERKRTICGTPNYIAPEILEGKSGHSYEVDIWSLGVILYTLLIGKPPFETNDVKSTYRKIRMNSYSFPEHITISNIVKFNQIYAIIIRNLIQRILQLEPAKRPTIEELQAHEFLHPKGTIPKLLPVSTLTCPPSQSYMNQFQIVKQILEQYFDKKEQFEESPKKSFEHTASPLFNKQFSLKDYKIDFEKKYNLARSGTDNIPLAKNSDINCIKQYCGSQQNSKPELQKIHPQNLYTSVDRFKVQTPIPMPTENAFKQNYEAQNPQNQFQKDSLSEPVVWIRKWVDYSSKYGLGYLLSNGQCGIFFNDCTKILLNAQTEQFTNILSFILKSDFVYLERTGEEQFLTLNNFPQNLNKKVTLLKHFRNYLLEIKNPISQLPTNLDSFKQTNKVFVKKWLKSKHAIIFRFSDKTIQVVFTDGTQVMLTQQLRVVTYIDKLQQRMTYLLSNALQSENHEMVKRLKYTKEILSQMLMGQNDQKEIQNYDRPISQKIEIITDKFQPLQEQLNKLNFEGTIITLNNIVAIESETKLTQRNQLASYNSTQKLTEKNIQTMRGSSNFQHQNI